MGTAIVLGGYSSGEREREKGRVMEFPPYPKEDYRREAARQDARHLWAIGILDAWARKHDEATPPVPVFHSYMGPFGQWVIVLIGSDGLLYARPFDTPWEARVTAAEALLEDDPTLEGD
jgi:hypothetical protein